MNASRVFLFIGCVALATAALVVAGVSDDARPNGYELPAGTR